MGKSPLSATDRIIIAFLLLDSLERALSQLGSHHIGEISVFQV